MQMEPSAAAEHWAQQNNSVVVEPMMPQTPTPPDQPVAATPIPTPSWLLVLAAREEKDQVSYPARDDAWSKLWRIPAADRGIRYISAVPDAEDKLSLEAQAKGQPGEHGGYDTLLRKYKAPGLLIATMTATGPKVTLYIRDYQTITRSEKGQSPEECRKITFDVVQSMLREGTPTASSPAAGSPTSAPAMTISSLHTRPDGLTDVSFILTRMNFDQAKQALAAIRGLTVIQMDGTDHGVAVAGVFARDDVSFPSAAEEAGFSME
jgi:hypothetical protein